jgi:hypothetical protein
LILSVCGSPDRLAREANHALTSGLVDGWRRRFSCLRLRLLWRFVGLGQLLRTNKASTAFNHNAQPDLLASNGQVIHMGIVRQPVVFAP